MVVCAEHDRCTAFPSALRDSLHTGLARSRRPHDYTAHRLQIRRDPPARLSFLTKDVPNGVVRRRMKDHRVKCEFSTKMPLTLVVFVLHRDGLRLRLARWVVDDGRPVRRAANDSRYRSRPHRAKRAVTVGWMPLAWSTAPQAYAQPEPDQTRRRTEKCVPHCANWNARPDGSFAHGPRTLWRSRPRRRREARHGLR